MVEEECKWDDLKEEEIERDALVVRLVVKAKIVEEVEGKKVMVGMMQVVEEERVAVPAPTVVAVELKEKEVKGSLAVAVGERSQVVLEEEEVIHLVVRL